MNHNDDIVFGRAFPQAQNLSSTFNSGQKSQQEKKTKVFGSIGADEKRLEELNQKQHPERPPELKPEGAVGSREAQRQQDFSRIQRLASRLNETRKNMHEETREQTQTQSLGQSGKKISRSQGLER
jgi:hypothetical protein